MKHIFLNLKRFDIPTEKAGVNAIAPVTEWGSYIIHHIQEPLEKYRGKDLLIDREQALPLAENENFIVDLINMDVYDEEEQRLGTLTDVLQTGANDVYVVETEEGKEILLPAIPSCILEVDVEAAKMIVRIPEGLL